MPTAKDTDDVHREQRLGVTDALEYLSTVKKTLKNSPDIYRRFILILGDFKSRSAGTETVIKRVSNLFSGYPALIQGFNIFLPDGYRLDCTVDGRTVTVTTPSGTSVHPVGHLATSDTTAATEASDVVSDMLSVESDLQATLSFLYHLKTQHSGGPEKYRQFLEIMNPERERDGALLIRGVVLDTASKEQEFLQRMAKLVRVVPELAREFADFLPPAHPRMTALLELLKSHRPSKDIGQIRSRKRKRTEMENSDTSQVHHKRVSFHAQRRRRLPAVSQSDAAPVASSGQWKPSLTTEGDFFERVKAAIGNMETYHEFLKLVNLFSQNVIDAGWLIRESNSFLGDGKLLDEFKKIIQCEVRQDSINWLPHTWLKPRATLSRPSISQLNSQYGSYRKLPDHETDVTCSGRDELCKSVLNDEYISQPTFASEDTVFQAHQKNIYEEALLRSEEERHEYDFYLSAIQTTIRALEGLSSKIEQLSKDELATFKLGPNLDGVGKGIHLRVLKKIYGPHTGLGVHRELHQDPARAIPAVLTRLRLKHEAWKRAQSAWDPIWREMDLRNYDKALDHQAIVLKNADKKLLSTRVLVGQIEAARDEQMAKRTSVINATSGHTRSRHQLEFAVEDTLVIRDALRLVLSYLDNMQGLAIANERQKVEEFLRAFIPALFVNGTWAVDVLFSSRKKIPAGASRDLQNAQGADNFNTSTNSGNLNTKGPANGRSAGDSRRRTVKNEQGKLNPRTRGKAHRSPVLENSSDPETTVTSPTTLGGSSERADEHATGTSYAHLGSQKRSTQRRYSFFANTTFYMLVRLFEILYSRLLTFKNMASELDRRPRPSKQFSDRRLLAVGLETEVHHPYDALLNWCEDLFANVLDHPLFEDRLRTTFGYKKAYRLFTIEKVVGTLVRQAQSAIGDAKSQELLALLSREREIAQPTVRDQINARRSAEKVIGPDENLFRIDWLLETRIMTVQLLGKDDSKRDNLDALTERWQSYVASFVTDERTASVSSSYMKRPFLRRTRTPSWPVPDVLTSGCLKVKVCVRTYRLFYVPGTNESLLRLDTTKEHMNYAAKLQDKTATRQSWLNTLIERRSVYPAPAKDSTGSKEQDSKTAQDDRDVGDSSRSPAPEATYQKAVRYNDKSHRTTDPLTMTAQQVVQEPSSAPAVLHIADSEPFSQVTQSDDLRAFKSRSPDSTNTTAASEPPEARSAADDMSQSQARATTPEVPVPVPGLLEPQLAATRSIDSEAPPNTSSAPLHSRRRKKKEAAVPGDAANGRHRETVEQGQQKNEAAEKVKCPYEAAQCKKRKFHQAGLFDHLQRMHADDMKGIILVQDVNRIRRHKTNLRDFWEIILPHLNLPYPLQELETKRFTFNIPLGTQLPAGIGQKTWTQSWATAVQARVLVDELEEGEIQEVSEGSGSKHHIAL